MTPETHTHTYKSKVC